MSCPLRIPYITAWELKLRSCMPFVPLAEKNDQIKRILNAERIQHWNFLPLSLVVFQCFEPIISAVLYNYNWYTTCSNLTRNESMMNMHVLFATAVCCDCPMNLRQCVCFGASINCNTGQVACLEVYECSLARLLLSFEFATCRCFLLAGMFSETFPSQLAHVLPRTYSMISCVGWCLYIFFVVLLHAEGVTTSTILRMETGLLYTRVDTGSSLLCFYRDTNRLKPGMCDSANLSSWVPCFWWWSMTNHGNFLSSMTHIIRMIYCNMMIWYDMIWYDMTHDSTPSYVTSFVLFKVSTEGEMVHDGRFLALDAKKSETTSLKNHNVE